MSTLAAQLKRAGNFAPERHRRWRIEDEWVGWMRHDVAEFVLAHAPEFALEGDALSFRGGEQPATRTAALERVTRSLAAEGRLPGWRDERFVVRSRRSGVPLFELERAAVRPFGVRSGAAHLNAFVRTTGGLEVWVARRSQTKPIDPGLLDTLVGGGIAAGQDAHGTLVKECFEEAGIPGTLASRASACGTLYVLHASTSGLHDEALHVFDLEVAPDFAPRNMDGEVASFTRLGIGALRAALEAGAFTVDATAATIDFLVRRRAIKSPECAALLRSMRTDERVDFA